MQQLQVRQAMTAGVVSSVFSIAYYTVRSGEPMYAFVAMTTVCSVVMLASAGALRLLSRPR